MARIGLKKDGSFDPSQPFGDAFDDILDELHSKSSPSGPAMSQRERDELEREDRIFRQALAREVNERLVSQGIRVRGVYIDPENGRGWLVDACDQSGRPFEARISVDEALSIGEQYAENMGREIIDILCQRVLNARAHWFMRMGTG